MHTIMVLNAKGGGGKSTLATNLASYYAAQGKNVALADYDPQLSSLEWLAARDEKRPAILGLDCHQTVAKPPRNTDVLIIDPPAAVHGKELTEFVRKAETIVIPVLPSPMDIRAAGHFIEEIRKVGKVERKQVKLALVANRVKEHTRVAEELDEFLHHLKITFITTLRDTMNYIRAAERGLGIFELAPYLSAVDREQWAPLVKYLNSKRSRP